MSTILKPPLSYYGGKQRMASKILPYIQDIKHRIYCEPFCGGTTMLFKKGRPNVSNQDHYREVINDIDETLITFYRVAKSRPLALNEKIQGTLYSRADYEKAVDIIKNGSPNALDVAWAVWVNLNQSFAKKFNGGWAYGHKAENTAYTINNKKLKFLEQIKRLEQVCVECGDACEIIKRWDNSDTLFYCDPPYISTAQGHYAGYTEKDYQELIDTLSNIKGSFVLSGYPNEHMPESWEYVDFSAVISSAHGKQRKQLNTKRVERIWIKT